MEGKVKFWNRDKGWGFITPDDGTDELFVHCNDISIGARKELLSGQRVFYRVFTTARGPKAVHVRPLDDRHETAA